MEQHYIVAGNDLMMYFINNHSPLLPSVSNRTVYIHGFNKMDFALWHSSITLAAGTDGKALSDQQLTKNGVPIIVESCIAFVTQYGKFILYLRGTFFFFKFCVTVIMIFPSRS